MSLSDPIGDMIARIKNAQLRNHKVVELPSSNFKISISEILKNEGYIKDYKINEDKKKPVLSINLKYHSGNPVISTIERISKPVRPQAVWQRSKDVLKASVDYGLRTKTGMMVGLGETNKEVYDTMDEMQDLGIDIFNIGQYLQPTKKHLKVDRYVTPEQFIRFKEYGLSIGFKVVESGPMVRSSYMADKQAEKMSSNLV